MDGIKQWIEAEGSGHCFFIAFPVIFLVLFIWLKGRRVRFLIPSLIISIVVVNPVFFKYWDKLGLYAYWRILWVVPVIPVVAGLIPSITERIQKGCLKNIVAAAGVGLIVLGGTFLYNGAGGSFVEAANAAKEPDYVVQIADRLLELEERPRVIAQDPIGVYLRQYTGEVDQLFGRDLSGHIIRAETEVRQVNDAINSSEWDIVNRRMLNDQFDYLVVSGRPDEGFELIDTVDDYGIYRAIGTPSVLKERNALGQVVKVTVVDENGNPINGTLGYSTVAYDYDINGNIVREFRTDIGGKGVADSNGFAGYERAYDSSSRVIMERMIDVDGRVSSNLAGYAEMRREFQTNYLVKESYYDKKGQLTNRIDTRYATIVIVLDRNRNRIEERYYDSQGNMTVSSAGYAKVKREYNQNSLTTECYYDENGCPISVAAGYVRKDCFYDAAGNMSCEKYYDASGNLTNCINGYACDEREYDSARNVIIQRYKDAEDNLVITGLGYAEVHRTYDGKHLIYEEYFGEEKESLIQPAGYCAIEQEWMGDTLYSRTYLDRDGNATNRTDGYAKAVWEQGETYRSVRFFSSEGIEIENDLLNLATNVNGNKDRWSDWIIPTYNESNSCKDIGFVNLGQKTEGDNYTCTLEIEFKNVSATEGQDFRFRTQGAQDGKWYTRNVWNSDLIELHKAPEDGVYTYRSTITVFGDMVEVSMFNIGFRCDYWASGLYRFRLVKIERGNSSSQWSPGV